MNQQPSAGVVFAYQKLLREIDDKISFIESNYPTRNSRDSINLIRLRMLKKDTERKYLDSIGGNLKSLFKRPESTEGFVSWPTR